MNKLKFLSVTIIIVMAAIFVAPNLQNAEAAAPANDDFNNATVIANLPFSETLDITEATTGEYDPYPCGYYPYNSVWYRFTPAEDMNVRVTAGITFNNPLIGVYTGSYDALSQISCASYSSTMELSLAGGTTYSIQVASVGSSYPGPGGSTLQFSLTQLAPPANDNFANARTVDTISFQDSVDNHYATTEPGEPAPGCTWYEVSKTVWYQYTPTESGSITAESSGFYYGSIAIYTGNALDQLTNLGCASFDYPNRVTIHAEQGITYYFQLGSVYPWEWGNLTFNLYVPPPPTADFWFAPYEPNIFDVVDFCSNSYDPVGADIVTFNWDSGDGVQQQGDNPCFAHMYPKDGDYTAYLQVVTRDGRSAEVTKVVPVRTHDVAITKFTVPQSARVGQTRQVVVGLRNSGYPENVTIELFKSTPYGYTWVGALNQSVPVRPSNRTTDFNFSYTFTNEDAKLGKLTFKAVATLNNARDAIPADNEAISMPVKLGK